jgi:hypothetical protein
VSAAIWNEPLPYRSEDPEPALCLSHYYPAPGSIRVGPMVCGDYAGHPESGGPGSMHAGGPAVLPHFWTDEDAALSLAEFGPGAVRVGPVCVECEIRPQLAGGRCAACCAEAIIRDQNETESEDAA